jgi:hypothetical protein
MSNLNTYGRFLDTAAKNRAKAEETEPVEAPSSPNVVLLKRVQRIVFGPNVKDLAEARSRFLTILDSIDDDEKESTLKKNSKPTV